MNSLLIAASLVLNLGLGYDVKDGGSFLSGGKYDGLEDDWRVHGLVNVDYTFGNNFGAGYLHGSSLADGLDGSIRDFDILYIKYQVELIK